MHGGHWTDTSDEIDTRRITHKHFLLIPSTNGYPQEPQTQMDQMTQQNAALVEESSAATQSLEIQAAQLHRSLSAFRL